MSVCRFLLVGYFAALLWVGWLIGRGVRRRPLFAHVCPGGRLTGFVNYCFHRRSQGIARQYGLKVVLWIAHLRVRARWSAVRHRPFFSWDWVERQDNRDLVRLTDRINISNLGDIALQRSDIKPLMVIRFEGKAPPFDDETLSLLAADLKDNGANVVVLLPTGVSIEALDEGEMADHGWFRREALA